MKPQKTTKKKTKKRKVRSREEILLDKCWKLWSLKIRLENSDYRGYCECVTCGVKSPYKEMQAGHFWHNVLNFDPINIHPQCVRCNHHLSGNLAPYSVWLINKYGQEEFDKLGIRAKMAMKGEFHTIEELEKFARELTLITSELLKRVG